MGDYKKPRQYFETSENLYSCFDSIWRISVAEAFMSIIYCQDDNYDKALKSLKNAVNHSSRIKNPHEIGVVYRAKAYIRVEMQKNEELSKVFEKYLAKDAVYYCDEAIKHLSESND